MQDLENFLKDPDWDFPIFKKLAKNDTSQATGHQAGMVLPKVLRKYFPLLDEGETSAENPTSDRDLKTEMFVDTDFKTSASLRYQIQTWGGTRTSESRITDGLNHYGMKLLRMIS